MFEAVLQRFSQFVAMVESLNSDQSGSVDEHALIILSQLSERHAADIVGDVERVCYRP